MKWPGRVGIDRVTINERFSTEFQQGKIIRRETVAAKGKWSARLEPGQTLTLIDTMGQQAIDFPLL